MRGDKKMYCRKNFIKTYGVIFFLSTCSQEIVLYRKTVYIYVRLRIKFISIQ